MKLTIPTNWAPDYFDKIDFSQTEEIYGKMNPDLIGGGRAAVGMPTIKKDEIAGFINKAHQKGLKFSYLINGTCFDNLEVSRKGYRQIREFLDWLSEIGVDSVTVALPMLVEMVKKFYPNLQVSVALHTQINTFERAMYWESLGADKINVSHVDVNKNFEELRKIRKAVKCKIQVLGNLMCQNKCPSVILHANFNAHASQNNHVMKNFGLDYYLASCSGKLLSQPVEILKSAFIRPEDMDLYEQEGVDYLKLADRYMTTDALAYIVKAYTERKYEGNIMDLMLSFSKYRMFTEGNLSLLKGMKYVFNPAKVNVFKLGKYLAKLNELRTKKSFNKSFDIFIDNTKLDGFMKIFYENKCTRRCEECRWCDRYAEKAVSLLVPAQEHADNMEMWRETRDVMVSGDIF